MLKCLICSFYSHSICYDIIDSKCSHVCAKCAVKSGQTCTSETVLSNYKRAEKSKPEKKKWVFELMKKRVLISILHEEFKLIQPGSAPDENFLRLRFQISESYATRLLLSLMREGAIVLYGGFKFDVNRIHKLLGSSSSISFPPNIALTSALTPPRSILKPIPVASFPCPTLNVPGPSGCSKKLRFANSPSPASPPSSPIQNPFDDDSSTSCSENSSSSVRSVNSPSSHKSPSPGVSSIPQKRKLNSEPPLENPANSCSDEDLQTPKYVPFIPTQKQFQNHFVWPDRFMSRESRKEDEVLEPASIADFGKKSKRQVFGQIIETRELKENSNNPSTWNFHFIVGKGGVLVQAWVFGPKAEVKIFSEKIRVDEYFVFWGYQVKENKYTTSLSSNLEWGLYIPSNSTKFERVHVTKVFQKTTDSSVEEQEVFSNSFRQAGTPHKLSRKPRKREQSYKEKLNLIDKTQRKITEFVDDSLPLLLHDSNDSFHEISS